MTVQKNIRGITKETKEIREKILDLINNSDKLLSSYDISLIINYGKKELPDEITAKQHRRNYQNISGHLNNMEKAELLISEEATSTAPLMKKVWRMKEKKEKPKEEPKEKIKEDSKESKKKHNDNIPHFSSPEKKEEFKKKEGL